MVMSNFKLITEYTEGSDIKLIVESEDGSSKKKYFIEGPFIQAEAKNRNGRIYKRDTLLRECEKYTDEKISKKRSMGELDHPENPTINMDRVSHIITELKMDGDVGYGRARVLDTPMGRIAKTLIDEGIEFGVSSRGLGTVSGDIVNDNYKLVTVDIVADPSAPSAFVKGILENKTFIVSDDDSVAEAVEILTKHTDKNGTRKAQESKNLFMEALIQVLKKKHKIELI